MVNDPLALATPPDAPSEDEYQAFLAALSESARGRAFLAEHARRSRSEDSATLLSSVQRLEGLVRAQVDAPPAENPIDDVRGMLEAIRAAQADIDLGTLTAQVAKLADLIEGVQQRIDTLATPPAPPPEEPAEPAVEPVAETVAAEEVVFAAALEEPAETVEPESVEEAAAAPEPELPEVEPETTAVSAEAEIETAAETAFDVADITPEPVVTPAAEIAGLETTPAPEPEPLLAPLEFMAAGEATDEALPETAAPVAFDEDAAMPEVAWGNESSGETADEDEAKDSAAPSPPPGLAISALVETLVAAEVEAQSDAVPEATVIKAGSIPPPPPYTGEDFSGTIAEQPVPSRRARAVPPPVDPLADIKALTEEERLALFT